MLYFEVWFSPENSKDIVPPETICIKAMREPTVDEASTFCRTDEEMLGRKVVNVTPLTEVEARSCFDFSNEDQWPVFGGDTTQKKNNSVIDHKISTGC